MSQYIYKYIAPDYLDKVLPSPEKITLKCSRPKDFNDPYELFLTINFKENPDVLAFYADLIGNLPQLPTTCFSRSPLIIPMWAHYADTLQGFAIEFDESILAKTFPEIGFGNVDYKNAADSSIAGLLYHAFEIGKPRHLYILRQRIFSAAYYTKVKCWSYELERRMIVPEKDTRLLDNHILIDIPANCVTALICGPRASPATIEAVRTKAQQLGCKYYLLQIGKTSPVPFLTDGGDIYIFDGAKITASARKCASCQEPLKGRGKRCSWCRINDTHKQEAAMRNTFRMMDYAGLLKDYLKDMDDITRRFRKNDN